jgi:hypothetical protein
VIELTLDGCADRRIADCLDISLNSVAVNRSLALRALRERYHPDHSRES